MDIPFSKGSIFANPSSVILFLISLRDFVLVFDFNISHI